MAQKQHFQAHKADGMCLLIGPVSPVLFFFQSSPSSLSLQAGKGKTLGSEHEETQG